MSEGQELMLKAMGILRENMGSSPMLSLGRVVARSFLSPMEGVVPGGRVRLGETAGLVSTIVTVTCHWWVEVMRFTEAHATTSAKEGG